MRFHDFDTDEGAKLEEWHALAKMRPLAPPAHKPKAEPDPRQAGGGAKSEPDAKKPKTPSSQTPAFLRKLVEGNALEMLHEDGIWPVDLVGISDEKGFRPPRASAKAFSVGKKKEGEDNRMWETRHGKLGDEWFPLDDPAWRPPRPGDEGVVYKVKTYPYNDEHSITDAELLRPCYLWDRAARKWSSTTSRKEAVAHVLHDEATDRKLRNRVRAASQPPPLPLAAQFAVGQRVEAAQTEEGMLGAWFGCKILEIKPGVGALSGKANVEMDDLDEADGGGKLREWVSLVQLRPEPPDADAEAFAASLEPGGHVEFAYVDGWWEVEVTGVAERGKGRERQAAYSLRYSREVIAEHHGIKASDLRPAWHWRGGDSWVQGAEAIHEALSACGGLPTLGDVVTFQPGSPNAPAALFASGTRRLGLDGEEWVVALDKEDEVAWLRAFLPPKPQGKKGKGQGEGESLLAYKIELHWPLDERWYRATIIKCVPRTGKHLVVYEEDGVQEYVHLEQEEWRVVQVPQPGEAEARAAAAAAPPPPPPKKAKKEAAAPKPDGEAPPPREPRGPWPKVEAGQLVEVAPGDAGYVGAWYLADVLALKERQRQLVVEYHDFDNPDGSRIQEETGAGFVRPQPPGAPEGWLSGLKEGSKVEVRHEEGWWEAVLVSIKAGGGSSRRQQGAKYHVKPAPGCELPALSDRVVGETEVHSRLAAPRVRIGSPL